MNIKRIGLDLAKQVFQLHGIDSHEQTVLKKKLKWEQMTLSEMGYASRL